MTIIVLIIFALFVGGLLYWFLILRSGRMSFWKVAASNPDAAYHLIRSAPCWKYFEGELPKDYRSIVPKSEWAGPFKLKVPKLAVKKSSFSADTPNLKNLKTSSSKPLGKTKGKRWELWNRKSGGLDAIVEACKP